MCRRVSMVVAFVWFAWVASAQSAESALPKPQGIKSWEADVTIEMSVSGQKVDVTGAICAKKPNRMRMELTVPTRPGTKQYVYADGRTVWVYMPELKMASKVDAALANQTLGLGQRPQVVDIADPFAGIAPDSVRELPPEELNGQACRVFEGAPARLVEGKLPFVPTAVKLWISKKTKMILRQDMLAADGSALASQQFSNIKLNPELPDATFVFDPPKDVTVADMTAETVSALKGAK